MFLNSLEILEAAKVAMSAGSSDGARASMILVDTGGKVSEALMIHFYEQAQMDITREIARLTNRDLVTYHVDAAKKRVSEILNRLKSKAERESIALIRTKMIGGKILSRLRSKDKEGLSSAFDLMPQKQNVCSVLLISLLEQYHLFQTQQKRRCMKRLTLHVFKLKRKKELPAK